MTPRELLTAALSGEKTPRVPTAPFVFNNVVSEALGAEPDDPIAACIAYYKRFGFDILLRNYIVGGYLDETRNDSANWRVQTQTLNETGAGRDEITTITTPQRVLTQKKSYRTVSPHETVEAVTEYYIKDEEDFAQFVQYQPPVPGASTGSADVPPYDCSQITRARALIADDGLTGPWVHGAFNMLGSHRELSALLMDPHINPGFYAEMMEYFLARLLPFLTACVKAGADFISLSGNMASGSMAGPRMFQQYIMPYEQRVIDHIHALGAKVIYHNCGDAKHLLPLYAEMHLDMYESLAAPPYGDTDLAEALSLIPPPTALSGGVDQISFLKTATPAEVTARVKEVLALAKPRGAFVLAASDYFSEGTPEANIRALAEAGRAYGGY